jgi:hypothetical protein
MSFEGSSSMVYHNGYVAGWLNSSIAEFLGVLPRSSESAAYALITCLDSNTNPAAILDGNAELRAELNGVATLKNGLILPSRLLHKASLRSRLFFGFDEIWFFSTAEIEPKPQSASIVGPNRINQETLDELGHWMDANGCSLALGDGAGLNLIVKAYGLVKQVVAHSLAQPEPTFQMSPLWVQDEEKNPSPKKAAKRRAAEKAQTKSVGP